MKTAISRIEEVDLIFKTHLDLGFTDFAENVALNYFNNFIPQAIQVARKFREEGGQARFVWTTGSWLIYECLKRAKPSERAELEKAIEAGDICWHGLPFTTHSELMDPSLFEFGLSLSHELDRRFGKKTIAAKMTDVPGHTRGIVPLLAKAGIKFLHIGVNSASTAPDVPPVFVWRDQASQSEVIVMYHKEGYGNLMVVPGLSRAIAFAHTLDNFGPQSPEQVATIFENLQKQFEGAKIVASTMDHFAAGLLKVKDRLPVVTGEIGDTWIHGVGTDPKKVSRFRELLRLRREWLERGEASANSGPLAEFSRYLLMVPEHTWGLDEKLYLSDYSTYSNEELKLARQKLNFQKFEASWEEQREYLNSAVKALENTPLAQEARKRLETLEPSPPRNSGFRPVSPGTFDTSFFEVGFEPGTGAINFLRDKKTGRQWAGKGHLLGLFSYEVFSQVDYDRFWDQYIVNKEQTEEWSRPDFTKPGIAAHLNEHTTWSPGLSELYYRQDETAHHFLLELTAPTEAANFGCPKDLTLEISFELDEPVINFILQWSGKTACRLPEALWFSFCPQIMEPAGWRMEKLGELISPLEVVSRGNRALHAVGKGLTCFEAGKFTLEIITLDAPLVAPGEPSLVNFNNQQPNLEKGMHFNLFNNVWGTNFRMWYEEDARFRFSLKFG